MRRVRIGSLGLGRLGLRRGDEGVDLLYEYVDGQTTNEYIDGAIKMVYTIGVMEIVSCV